MENVLMFQIFIQLIGIIGLLIALLSFQKEKRGSILAYLIVAQVIFVLHFALLGAWIGAVMNAISALRSYISSQRMTKKWCSSNLWLYFFIIISWISGLFIWKSILSILPIIAMTIDSYATWNKNPKFIRLLTAIPRPLWFIYNYSVLSYAGMLSETMGFISIIAGIIRFDICKGRQHKNFLTE
jgi:hypothetical protein